MGKAGSHNCDVAWLGPLWKLSLCVLGCRLTNISSSGRGRTSTTLPFSALATELCQGKHAWRYVVSHTGKLI